MFGGLNPPKTYAVLFLLPFSLLIAAVLISSYGWRMEHDTPPLHYAAFLINEHGLVPYRDIFETSMPGTIAFHVLVTRLFGYSDLAFRLVDIGSVVLLSLLSLRLIWPWGRLAAISTAVIFSAIYLGYGQSMSLQRDYLGVILIAASLNIVTSRLNDNRRALLLGVLLGMAALIKPHLVVGAPVILWLAYRQTATKPPLLRSLLMLAAGGLLPLLAVGLWLGPAGALDELWALLWHYLPLYNQINGDFEILEPAAATAYRWQQIAGMGGFQLWLLGALAGCGLLLREKPEYRDWAIGLLLLILLYLVYASMAGKFWAYHFMPFVYFCVLGSCLLLIPPENGGWTLRACAPPLMVIALVFSTINGLHLYPLFIAGQLRSDRSIFPPKQGRVDRITAHLKTHAEPGDYAQALDTTGGAIHALLEAGLPLATPFIYNYHFYHHVSDPYISALRHRFMAALERQPPRFFVEITARNKPYVRGRTTRKSLPELEVFLSEHYRVLVQESDFQIYQRRELTP